MAFGFGEKAADPVAMYLSDLYTIPGSLAGIPGMSIPCGFGAKNRPVGLQLMVELFRGSQAARRRPPLPAGDRLAQAAAAAGHKVTSD